jgi:hypothetical protein
MHSRSRWEKWSKNVPEYGMQDTKDILISLFEEDIRRFYHEENFDILNCIDWRMQISKTENKTSSKSLWTINICVYIYMCVYVYVCIYLYIYICVCVWIYTHMYTYTYGRCTTKTDQKWKRISKYPICVQKAGQPH